MEYRQITIKELSENVGISAGPFHAIFSDILGIKGVAVKFVSKLLSIDQKNYRIFLAKNNNIVMSQSPYSTDLVSGDFFLATIKEMKTASLGELKVISEMLRGLEKSQGDYFEGNKIDIDTSTHTHTHK